MRALPPVWLSVTHLNQLAQSNSAGPSVPCQRMAHSAGQRRYVRRGDTVRCGRVLEDLLAFIEDGRDIPVVGAELLTVEEAGDHVPLYRAVAKRLLNKHGLSATALPVGEVLREHLELNSHSEEDPRRHSSPQR